MNLMDIKNYTYKDTHTIFFNLDLKINSDSFFIIVGPNKSEKTTLLKLLSGDIKSNIMLEDSQYVDKNTLFFSQTVLDELMLHKNSKKEIHDYLLKFGLLEYKNKSPLSLSSEDKVILKIIISLLKKPKLLLLDNVFSSFLKNEKRKVINILKDISIKEDFAVIYTSNDINDSIFFDNLYIINDKKLSSEIPNSLSVPFTVELSEKLLLYGLIKEEEYNLTELAKKVC